VEVKFIFNPEREESAGKPTNRESKLPNGKAMTREDIYEMLDKAGMHVSNDVNHIGRIWCSDEYPIDEELFRFAALVAAHEREACAKFCELVAINACDKTAQELSFAIRARGEK